MGCKGSKSLAVVAAAGDASGDAILKDTPNSKPSSRPSSVKDGSKTRPVTPSVVPPSTAFEIPFKDGKERDSSIVKKHPPLRLQKLEEQQQGTAQVTLQDLIDKQEEAEQRRQQYLQLRAQSAKRKYAIRTGNDRKDTPPEASHSAPTANDANEISAGENSH